jgi:leucyl aminopeptidase (aminopeptidase T)
MSNTPRISGSLVVALTLISSIGCKQRDRNGAGSESGLVTSSDSASPSALTRDHRSLAEKVVARSAGVKEGDVVLVFGSDEDLPLLEDLAVEVRKHGGSPLVTVNTNRLARRMYDEVPAKYDSQVPEMNLKLGSIVDVVIGTEAFEARTLKGVPPERMAARAKAGAAVDQLMRKRGVRTVILGNGLYPSAEQAEQFGLSRDQLADVMYSGIDADYSAIQATGEHVRKVLAGGKELRITHPNGTDLRLRIDGRPITVNDGVISAQEQKPGSAETSVWLPAGEVYLVPVPGTATGTLVSDKEFYLGQPIEGLRLEFKAGKLTSMTAKSGLDPLQAAYDAAGPGKDVLSVVDIGINSSLRVPEDNPIHAWSKAGKVTVVMGSNTWAGGSNQVNFGLSPSSPGTSVSVDGKALIQDGKLLVPGEMANR